MLQDNLRSAVYSSLKKSLLVPVEDSNEAGQCRTGRKSRTNSTKAGSSAMEKGMTGGNLHSSFGSTMPLPSFHLKQVSQGADNLNMMIESWSKGIDFDGQSGDIATDLLRGALDLQESLLKLGKLQEASKLTAQTQRKQKLSIEKEENCGREVDFNSLRDQNPKKNLEKPRNSVDGSSRNFVRLRDLLDGSSNFVVPRRSVDGSSRNACEQRNSIDAFPRDFVGRWNSLDGSSKNGIELRRSVDGSSRNGIEPHGSTDWHSRNFEGPRNSVDGCSRAGIELRRSVDGSSRNGIELRRSVDGSSRNGIEPRGSAHWFSRNFEGPRNSADGCSRTGIEPRKSVDSSSTDCIEELKKVIRDGLHKQNLLSAAIDEEMPASRRLSCDSFSDGPIAGSTQSPMCLPSSRFKNSYSDKKVKSYDSLASSSQRKEVKTPNLIAKLMGLEELPSETTQGNTKKLETKNTLSSHRPAFDTDMPKGRKPEFTEQKVDPEHKTLKEILETMQFKGLLKGNHAEDLKLRSRPVATSDPLKEHIRKGLDMKNSDDELPPIVIIKPLRYLSSKEEIAEPKQTLDQLGLKESKILHTGNESSSKIESKVLDTGNESSGKIESKNLDTGNESSGKIDSKVLDTGNESSKKIEAVPQLKKEKTKTTKNEMQKPLLERRVLAKEVDKTTSEEKEKSMQSVDEPLNPVKASISLTQKKRDAIKVPKKAQQMHKTMQEVVRVPKKAEEQKKPVKGITKSMAESQALAKKICPKPSKPENKVIRTKSHALGKKNTSQNLNTTSSAKPTSQNSNQIPKQNRRNTAKPVTESAITNTDNVIEKSKESNMDTDLICEIPPESAMTGILPTDHRPTQIAQDACRIQMTCEIQSESATNGNLPTAQLPTQTAQDACQIQSESPMADSLPIDQLPTLTAQDACQIQMMCEIQSESATAGILPTDQLPTQTAKDTCQIQMEGDNESKCDIVCGISQIEGNFKPVREANQSANYREKFGKTNRPDLRQLLLSSPSFTNSAEELFDLHINQNMFFDINDQESAGVLSSSELLLDSVDELMRHKHCRGAHLSHPIVLARTHISEIHVTVDKLLDELIDGIENLEYYSKVAGALGKNGLYSMLGRDLRCKGLVGDGVWDSGWLNGFSSQDADEVVGEVEQHALDLLINEIVAGLASESIIREVGHE